MRRALGVTGLALLLMGCAARAQDAAISQPPTADLNVSAAGAGPSGAIAYGVMVDELSSRDTYRVSLVSDDGLRTSVSAAKRRPIADGSGKAALDLPYVSTTLHALYYLNGDALLFELPLDSLQPLAQPVMQLSVGDRMEAAFAVSPDDATIAVSVLDFSRSPVHLLLYTANLRGGDRHVIFESDTDYVWPVAWHQGLIVLAHANGPHVEDALRAAPARDNPYWAVSYHLVNPADATREVLMGQCTASGPLTPAGSACIQGGSIDWAGSARFSGNTHDWGAISAAASISPDGTYVAAADPGNFGQLDFWREEGTIATFVDGPGAPEWAGWIDDTHVIVTSGTDSSFEPRIVTLSTGPSPALFLAVTGFYAARLPTDLI